MILVLILTYSFIIILCITFTFFFFLFIFFYFILSDFYFGILLSWLLLDFVLFRIQNLIFLSIIILNFFTIASSSQIISLRWILLNIWNFSLILLNSILLYIFWIFFRFILNFFELICFNLIIFGKKLLIYYFRLLLI